MIETSDPEVMAGVGGGAGAATPARMVEYEVAVGPDWLGPFEHRDGSDPEDVTRSARRFFEQRWGIEVDPGRLADGQWFGDGRAGLAVAWTASVAPGSIASAVRTSIGQVSIGRAPAGPDGDGTDKAEVGDTIDLTASDHVVSVVTVLSDYRTGRVDVAGRPEVIPGGWSLIHGRSTVIRGRRPDHLDWWTERPVCLPGTTRAVPARSTSIEIDLVGRDGSGRPLEVAVTGRRVASGDIDASVVVDLSPRVGRPTDR